MPVLCWHYTPSLWPWSLWTLSCTVSMTTTQGRLLVTCVGGFACTEWELHNRLKREGERESLWQCSACWNENQLYESCNGAITEHVADDGEVAVFLFIQTDISHINTLHNCSGSHYSSNPECLSCGTQLACERSKKKNQKCRWHVPVLLMKASWHPLTDPELLVFLPVGENPAISCGEAPFGWDGQSITLHCGSPLLLSPVLLAHTTEMQVGDLSRLNPQKSDRPPAL